jgi:hypothetical protein
VICIWEHNLRTRGVRAAVKVMKYCRVTRFQLHKYTTINKLKSQENQFYGEVILTWYFVTDVLVQFRDTLFSFTYIYTHTQTHTLLTSPCTPYLFVLFNFSHSPHYAVLYVCVFIVSSAWCLVLTNSQNTHAKLRHAHNTHFQRLRCSHSTKELNIQLLK